LNLNEIRNSIYQAALQAGRSADAVSLMVVSKNQLPEAIYPLLEAGQRFFGEARVQETASKWSILRKIYLDCHVHLIGPLQTNKVRQALELFDAIESVDRPDLILKLAKEWSNPHRKTHKLLIQVNTGQEPQKSGVLIDDLPDLIHLCHYHNLPITGLMCIPPLLEDPALHFQKLANLAKTYNLPELSMGMSGDYPLAIAHGATCVRIGSAIWKS
jgi:pyridoxal phosphate enzyme (YggS family)